MHRIGGLALLTAMAVPAAATAQTPPDAAALKAIEAKVPPQGWYPADYYDIRIAAEAQIAERPRTRGEMVIDWQDGEGPRYDVIDCSAESYYPSADYDAATARYATVAIDVSRIRSELERLRYPLAAYDAPLLRYERARLDDAARQADAETAGEDAVQALDDAMAEEESPEAMLAAAVDANRARVAPKLPKVIVDGGCGAGDGAPVIVRTAPAGGEVLLVNAFAFKVCTRKTPDPWDRFACKWNEIETGAERQLSGRYVYQVKWPDGTVRKGTREIVPNEDGGATLTVTFRKTGS